METIRFLPVLIHFSKEVMFLDSNSNAQMIERNIKKERNIKRVMMIRNTAGNTSNITMLVKSLCIVFKGYKLHSANVSNFTAIFRLRHNKLNGFPLILTASFLKKHTASIIVILECSFTTPLSSLSNLFCLTGRHWHSRGPR